MKFKKIAIAVILICVSLLFIACDTAISTNPTESDTANSTSSPKIIYKVVDDDSVNIEEYMHEEAFSIEDFQSIVVGKSTNYDVLAITSKAIFYPTYDGGYYDFPIQEGGFIRIWFYQGSEIVGAIEIIE